MIDPDGIILTTENLTNEIQLGKNIPECDYITYDLDNDKEFKKYISAIENEVRGSFEYKHMVKYLKDYMGMDTCSFISTATARDGSKVKIEIHHYPFTLYDIVMIVFKKRHYYHENLDVQMVAKEVMQLHYQTMVGLISLSQTVHELVHSGKIFIPVDHVYGRYELFVDYYKPFCEPEQLEVLSRIEKYTQEETRLLDTTILNDNLVTFQTTARDFQLPDMSQMNDGIWNRINEIKDNGYALPNIRDKQLSIEEKKRIQKQVIKPFHFDESLIEK